MSAIYLRGGLPRHMNEATANNVLQKWDIHGRYGGVANYLWFRNTGAADILLSLNRVDAAAGVGKVVASGGGTIAIPAEAGAIWTLSAAGVSAFESIVFIRRG